MATYTRQSSFSDGDTITAALLNNEYDQLLSAFHVSSGHTHDGSTTGDGGPLSTLYSNALTFGTNADTDIVITFNANSNNGVLTWMEDEDYFKFSDDILINSTERLNFQDTGTYIYSSTDGQLDLVADTEIQIAATTIDINGAVALNGAITGATNITLSGELDAATLDISGDADIDGTLEADAITINGTAIGSLYGAVAGSSSIVTTGALNSGSITSGFTSIDVGAGAITTTGVITGGTVEATTDTAASDNAAIGYTATEGLILTGQGSTSDVTIKNDADETVLSIPTGGGAVLLAKTASDFDTAGIELRGISGGAFTRASGTSLYLNRKTNDGKIIECLKDNSLVGAIGTEGGDLVIGTGVTALQFCDSVTAIRPHNMTTNAGNDAAFDLGTSALRFKDIYLSGGIALGGTDAAHTLDDYEEGEWTPAIDNTNISGFDSTITSSYSGTSGAYYTKIGNLVNITGQFQMGNSTGNVTVGDYVEVTGMPFTSATQVPVPVTEYRYTDNMAYTTLIWFTTTTIRAYVRKVNGTPLRNGGSIRINMTYMV